MAILGNDLLLAFLEGDSKARSKIDELSKFHHLSTTAVEAFELFKHADDKKKMDALQGLLESLEVLPFTMEASEKAALIEQEFKGIDLETVFSSAATIAHNDMIISRNKQFDRIKGLKVEGW